MNRTYNIHREGDGHVLERLTYPRFRAIIDFERPIPEIKEINFLEDCNANEIAGAIKEIGLYLEKRIV